MAAQISESVLPTDIHTEFKNNDKTILSVSGSGVIVTTNPSTGLTLTLSAAPGWATPTGTLSRATFISDSVTLPNLGAAVAALIVDLKGKGILSA